MNSLDTRKEKNTPRILRAIRRKSKKFDREPEDRSNPIKDKPHRGNSKSSVVVLYHEKSYEAVAPPSSLKVSRSDPSSRKSDRGAAQRVPNQLRPRSTKSSSYHDRSKSVESREEKQPIDLGSPVRRKFQNASSKQADLDINIYQEKQVVRVAGTCGGYLSASDVLRRSVARRSLPARALIKPPTNPITLREKSLNYRRAPSEASWNGKSESSDVSLTDLGEHCRYTDTAVPNENRNCRGVREWEVNKFHEDSFSNFIDFAQQAKVESHTQGINTSSITVNAGNCSSNRVFPFRATPSGNLKVIPSQVVFESKKVSVLVADPRNTKVNVKAELNQAETDEGTGRTSERISLPKHIDLLAGVTPSAINQLQFQGILPELHSLHNQRMQPPHKSTVYRSEHYQKPNPMPHPVQEMREVPLSSLGFTGEQPIDWDNIILPAKSDLYQELAKRITNYKNADCIVRIDQDEFHCHLLVLQSYSAFFDEYNCKQVDLTGSCVTSAAFSTIYDWMISAPGESCQLLQRDNVLEIFAAAQHLAIQELEEQCWAFLNNEKLFVEDTAFLLYQEAKRLGNTPIMELMLPRIMRFFLMLVSSKDFLDLSVDELCLLLKSNHICVNCEMEVLMSAVRWLWHDWANRKKYSLEVLKCVRFGLIAPWQLVDVKRNPENPEFIELMKYPEVQKMIDDGLAFVVIKYWYGNQTEDYYHWIELLGLSEPPNRNWVGEDKNYVTYREFLQHLQEYRRTKISDMGHYKIKVKPSPPCVPPTDSSMSSCNHENLHEQRKLSASGIPKRIESEFKTRSSPSRVPVGNYPSQAMLSCLMLPPELCNAHFSHLKCNDGKKENATIRKALRDNVSAVGYQTVAD